MYSKAYPAMFEYDHFSVPQILSVFDIGAMQNPVFHYL